MPRYNSCTIRDGEQPVAICGFSRLWIHHPNWATACESTPYSHKTSRACKTNILISYNTINTGIISFSKQATPAAREHDRGRLERQGRIRFACSSV